jgi:CheY-like chemotaxis protein
MKTNSDSHGQEVDVAKSETSAPVEANLAAKLRPQLDAFIELAERVKTRPDSDENAHQILKAARKLIDTINREPSTPRDGDSAAATVSSEQCDVLYIEDNPISFASVKLLLGSKRALKLLQATNGETGVAFAETRRPKLILLDLDLPDIHGSEVIQHLQKNPATAHIPVVVISGDATPSQIERLLVLGARNYLTKPFEIEPFLTVVDEALQEAAL